MEECITPRILREAPLSPSNEILLPVGICRPGDSARYRNVVIDEMCGKDEENLANAKVRKSSSLSCTTLLRRAVQSIPGLIQDKQNPMAMIDIQPVRDWMTQIDRDFLLISLFVLSGRETTEIKAHCNNCDEAIVEPVKFSDLVVYDWPETAPLSVSGILPKGYEDKDGVHREFTLAFPSGLVQENVIAQARGNTGKASSMILAACLQKLGDHDYIDTEMASRMKSMDRKFIGSLHADAYPGMMLDRKVSCDICGRVYEKSIDLSGFFGRALAQSS